MIGVIKAATCAASLAAAGLTGTVEQPGQPAEERSNAQASQPLEGTTLLPLRQMQTPFRVLEGSGAAEGKVVQLRLDEAEGERGRWVLSLGDLNSMTISRDSDGAVVIHRLTIGSEGKSVEYEQPVTLVPASVEPGRMETLHTQATVRSTDTGETDGTASVAHTVEPVTRARIETPDGTIEGYYIVIEQTLDMNMADITINLECAYEPGNGLIFRRQKTSILKLGLFGDTYTRTVALADSSRGDRGSPEDGAPERR